MYWCSRVSGLQQQRNDRQDLATVMILSGRSCMCQLSTIAVSSGVEMVMAQSRTVLWTPTQPVWIQLAAWPVASEATTELSPGQSAWPGHRQRQLQSLSENVSVFDMRITGAKTMRSTNDNLLTDRQGSTIDVSKGWVPSSAPYTLAWSPVALHLSVVMNERTRSGPTSIRVLSVRRSPVGRTPRRI